MGGCRNGMECRNKKGRLIYTRMGRVRESDGKEERPDEKGECVDEE